MGQLPRCAKHHRCSCGDSPTVSAAGMARGEFTSHLCRRADTQARRRCFWPRSWANGLKASKKKSRVLMTIYFRSSVIKYHDHRAVNTSRQFHGICRGIRLDVPLCARDRAAWRESRLLLLLLLFQLRSKRTLNSPFWPPARAWESTSSCRRVTHLGPPQAKGIDAARC